MLAFLGGIIVQYFALDLIGIIGGTESVIVDGKAAKLIVSGISRDPDGRSDLLLTASETEHVFPAPVSLVVSMSFKTSERVFRLGSV